MEFEPAENPNCKLVSYLVARDPSIPISYGISGNGVAKKKLYDVDINEDNESEELEQPKTLQIFLRLKKNDSGKNSFIVEDNEHIVCIVPDHIHNVKTVKNGQLVQKKYQFTRIFGENTIQSELFHEILKPKIVSFINGQNSNILTYGASGSGKTFTIMGTPYEPGLIPRSLDYIFRTIQPELINSKLQALPNGSFKRLNFREVREKEVEKLKILNSSAATPKYNFQMEDYRVMRKRLSSLPVATLDSIPDCVSVSIWITFAEIYNEEIFDLLVPSAARGQARKRLQLGSCGDHSYVKNLTSVSVKTSEEAYQILQCGLHNLKYASTGVNQHSSRSHCIFSLQLVQASDVEDGYNVSYFNFCDLAGSERLKKTNNVGDRLKESNNINNSLLVLGRCISAVKDSQKSGVNRVVPYRDSKLTQLFRKALSGQEDITMVVTINPDVEMFEETQHVLNFSAIAKEIIIEDKSEILKKNKELTRFTINPHARSTSYSPVDLWDKIEDLELENERLRMEMDQNEIDVRKQLIDFHNEVLEEERQRHKRQMARLEEEHRNELKRMEAIYNRNINNKIEVIDLDSSDEENDEMKEKLSRYESELREKQEEISSLRMELQVLKNKLDNCAIRLAESVKERNEALAAYVDAKESNTELNNAVSELTSVLAEKTAMIDKLEEQLVSRGVVLIDNQESS